MASSTLVETSALTVVRLALAYACRQHLGTLFNDLRDLSAGVDPSSSSSDGALSPCPASPSSEHLPSPALSPAPTRAAFARMPWTVRWPASVSRTVFGACFSESCVLFLLVTCQALGVLDARTRLLNWRISLALLMCLMTIVVPLLQCLLVTYRSPVNLVTRIILTLVPFGGYLFLLSFVTPPPTLASHISTAYLARYIVLGVCILGLLSGFGATSAAWEFLVQPFLFSRSAKWRNITEADIASTELALARIRQDLHKRETELERQANAASASGSQAQQSKGWVSRVFGSGDNESKILQTEMGALRALEGEMSGSLARMRARRAELDFRASVGGALWLAAGKAFGCYCALRIVSTILALIFHRSSTETASRSDFGAHVIGLVLPYVPLLPIAPTPENAEIIARHASLLLVGAIVLSSVRLVLRGVGRALKLTGKGRRSGQRNIGASIMLLFLAQIMGTYLLSTLIQLRTSFPGRKTESELFASLPRYEPFEPAFNWAFLGAALATGVARAIGWVGV